MEHFELERVEGEMSVQEERQFFCAYQEAILLALVESKRLSEEQYRSAEKKLTAAVRQENRQGCR